MENIFKKLQNGSDVRGIACKGIEGEEVNLNDSIAYAIAYQFVSFLSEKTGKKASELKISVGGDSRITRDIMMGGVMEGILDAGAFAASFGLCSTPAMFMSTVLEGHRYDGAIMITASHLPFNRNGLKFFTKDGGLDKKDIKYILENADSSLSNKQIGKKSYETIDFLSDYSKLLCAKIIKETKLDKPFEGLKIVVDAGNGAGGFFANSVLKELGADISDSQFLEPDGNFPNHIPNPEDSEAINSIKKQVVDKKADLGIIFDTDVDRVGAVLANGEAINRNALIAMISSIVLEEQPNSTIVTDSITSTQLTSFIENDLGGKHHRFKRGYKNVINEAIRLNSEGVNCELAIETSGHAALKENYFLDDGAYLISKILIKMALLNKEGKKLDSLIEDLAHPLESEEYRIKIKLEDFKAYGEDVIEEIRKKCVNDSNYEVVTPNYEGVRVQSKINDGWFLLRLSLHDPILPLNIESSLEGGVNRMKEDLIRWLSPFEELDLNLL